MMARGIYLQHMKRLAQWYHHDKLHLTTQQWCRIVCCDGELRRHNFWNCLSNFLSRGQCAGSFTVARLYHRRTASTNFCLFRGKSYWSIGITFNQLLQTALLLKDAVWSHLLFCHIFCSSISSFSILWSSILFFFMIVMFCLPDSYLSLNSLIFCTIFLRNWS